MINQEKSNKRGKFIVIEGIDGSGKSTQIQTLGEWLPLSGLIPKGKNVVITKEPGATQLGNKLRNILLETQSDQNCELAAPCSKAALFLFMADRAQHVHEVIEPALNRGNFVLCDRFNGSTMAYQGYGDNINITSVDAISKFASNCLKPDLVIYLDISVQVSIERRRNTIDDRIEQKGMDYLLNVQTGFLKEASLRNNWDIINANGTKEEVFEHCKQAILNKFWIESRPGVISRK